MAIIIDLVLVGANSVQQGLSKVQAQATQLQAQIKGLGGGSGARGGSSSRGVPSNRSNPNSAQSQSNQALLSAAQRMGLSARSLQGLQNVYRQQTATNRINRMINAVTPQTPQGAAMKAFQQAVFSSRLNLGPVSPLIGKLGQLGKTLSPLLQTLGVDASALGPLGMVAGVAALAISGMAYAANEAKDILEGFRALQDSTGGKASELALGASVGKAIGQDSKQFAGTVKDFVDKISSGGVQEGVASGYGIQGVHNALDRSGQNDLALYLKAVGKIRQMSEEEARRFARLTGHEELMQFKDMSAGTYKQMVETAKQAAEVTQDDRQALADFNGQMAIAGGLWDRLMKAIGTPLMKDAAVLLEGFNNQWAINMQILEKGGAALSFLGDTVTAMANPIATLVHWIERLRGIGSDNGEEKQAIDEHTKAMIDHSRALKGAREIYGGGTRTNGALPAGWRYNTASDNWASQGRRLGAF